MYSQTAMTGIGEGGGAGLGLHGPPPPGFAIEEWGGKSEGVGGEEVRIS